MPHQLIRILGINIRDPQTQLPSCQIAELKTKKRVMAVGINGVGKSSFMRLLPLFYGATPQQILRGTSLTSMISHTLPDASSAVAYEYCRETDDDLRCVVMHCRLNEEAPQFHIIHGGYREDFFYDDENDEYVRREDFAHRVREKGFDVTRMLVLSEYRAVILNERAMTKNGDELRKLAALHSLGPRSLRNLEQIAAAMASEKISFRDLKEIVIERVSDSQIEDKSRANFRELKKSKKDVTKWLDDRDHLARIMAEKPLAMQIKTGIERISDSHYKLCSLHVAVKEAIKQVEDELTALARKQNDLNKEMEDADVAYQANKGKLVVDEEVAYSQWKGRYEAFTGSKLKLDRFSSINVVGLHQEQLKEPSLKAEFQSAEAELKRINETSGGLAEKAAKDKGEIALRCAKFIEESLVRQLAVKTQIGVDINSLREAETEALNSLETPERLMEIGVERTNLLTRIGELNGSIKNPQANAELRKAREDAFQSFKSRSDELNKARDTTKLLYERKQNARISADTANESISTIELAQRACQLQIDELERELTPAVGSLLAFVRRTDRSVWGDLVKVINPALINNTNLTPEIVDELLSLETDGELIANGVSLKTGGLEQPYWVEMADVKNAIASKKSELSSFVKELSDAKGVAQKLKKEFDQCESTWNAAVAVEGLSLSAYETANKNHERAVAAIKQGEILNKQNSETEIKDRREEVAALGREETSIKSKLIQDEISIKAHFLGEINLVTENGETQISDIELEKSSAERQKNEDLWSVDVDLENKLAGLGIDPKRAVDLAKRLKDIDVALRRIANSKHDVESWIKFKADVLPSMATDEMECNRLNAHHLDVKRQQYELDSSFASAVNEARSRYSNIEGTKSDKISLLDDLRGLLRSGLSQFADFVAPKNLMVDWTPIELGFMVKGSKDALTKDSEELARCERRLRNLMQERSGPVDDWINLKKRDLPDRQIVQEHIYACMDARVLCDWFDPQEHTPYVDQLNKEMNGYLAVAGSFVRDLELFERKVEDFNRELKKSLELTESFARFKNLTVNIRSGIGQLENISLLRTMSDMSNSKNSSFKTIITQDGNIPSKEDASIIRQFRDILPVEGSLRVKLDDQVRLECSLVENGKHVLITNDVEFAAVSSNGNTALITSMFLVGFIEMVRGANSPVRLTWITDEIGRFDGSNLGAFLNTLDSHNIDVISACPSVDPALARYYPRISVFENDGGIKTTELNDEDEYVEA